MAPPPELRRLILLLVSWTGAFLASQQQKGNKPISIWILTSFFVSVLFVSIKSYLQRSPPVYLVDFSCLKPPVFCRVPFSAFVEHASMSQLFDEGSLSFMAKVLQGSGQSEMTCLPPSLHSIPPATQHRESITEAHMSIFPLLEDLLTKTRLSPQDIDILIVSCGGFCPSPSLCSIIANKYSMRADTRSYNISGMGCSAGNLCIDMAKDLLKIHKNSCALIVTTEILSTGWYSGKEKEMLLLNCLFRMGSSAVILTNKKEAKTTSKYSLLRTIRTHGGFDDKAYRVVFREEDPSGLTGVRINRDTKQVAREIIHSHLTSFGAAVLPVSEKLRHVFRRSVGGESAADFRSVVQHYCLPTSGQQVIREVGKGIRMKETEMEAALMTLHRFGNQSSSALWYQLAYIEAKERVREGDRVWQLGLGSGTKCSSVVWECIRPIFGESSRGPWTDCISSYPISD